jgi:hypothetical protein
MSAEIIIQPSMARLQGMYMENSPDIATIIPPTEDRTSLSLH